MLTNHDDTTPKRLGSWAHAQEAASLGDRLRALNVVGLPPALRGELAAAADALAAERDDWRARRDQAVAECRYLHQDGLPRAEWHRRYCHAAEAATRLKAERDELQGAADAIRRYGHPASLRGDLNAVHERLERVLGWWADDFDQLSDELEEQQLELERARDRAARLELQLEREHHVAEPTHTHRWVATTTVEDRLGGIEERSVCAVPGCGAERVEYLDGKGYQTEGRR